MMDSDDLVSIIMPTYNHGSYISRALDSVIDQTYKNWELIIVDNNSNDITEDIVSMYSNIKIKHLKINNYGVIGVSRNHGVAMAEGKWIAFLDSDDWWEKTKLELVIEEIKRGASLIYHNVFLEYTNKKLFSRKILKTYQVKSPVTVDLLTLGNPIATSSVVVRKDILIKVGGMSEDRAMLGAEDFNTWLKIAKITDQFKFIPKALGTYYIHAEGLSRKDMSGPMRVAVAELQNALNLEERKILESRLQYIQGRYFYLHSQYLMAETCLINCLQYGDLQTKIKVLFMLIKIKIYL